MRELEATRIQIHKAGDEVRIWSRRLSEVTPKGRLEPGLLSGQKEKKRPKES